MKVSFYLFLFLLTSTGISYSQTYSGPVEGQINSGSITNTDNFARVTSIVGAPVERGIHNVEKPADLNKALLIDANVQGKYVQDASVINSPAVYDTAIAVMLKNFSGIAETNSIPPDPYCAVGPAHFMAVVNSRFGIWDKEGNLLKNIDAATWYRTVYSAASPFDPKVLYDHFAKRWIMVWLHQDDGTQKSFYFLSVSDDSIPNGKWYNWALPSNQNGNTVVDNWGDYEGVGFDKDAIYISSNQFQFNGSFQYVKIRIIPKAQLLVNDTIAGPVEWNDIYNINYPSPAPNQRIFNLRPSISYSEGDYYLLHAPGAANFMALYKITNPTTTPVLTGSVVPVTNYAAAPNANQPGGSAMLIEAGGSYLRNEPVYRDGFLWSVHSIQNPTSGNSAFSSLRYVTIDVNTSAAVEDVSMGASGYWYYYPSLTVDQDYNVGISYSRSGSTEYPGAFYTYRSANDPSGLRGSFVLQSGKNHYEKDYSSGRNRWGDYTGIWLDPSDNYSMWVFGEYSTTALNTWGTWVGKIRIAPFSGTYPFVSSTTINFGNTEINRNSDTLTVILSNYGQADFVISNAPSSIGPFNLINQLSYPYSLSTYDTLKLQFVFSPTDTGAFQETFPVSTNDPALSGITLKGYGYKIVAGTNEVLYAISGASNNSMSLTINKSTGAGTLLGTSKQSEVRSIAMDPKTKIIYGVNTSNYIVRYNAEKGDVYNLFPTDSLDIYAVAFDTSGQLYCGRKNGGIYKVNLSSKSLTLVSTAKIPISDMVFNPLNNELWASIFSIVKKDRIFKIDVATGDTVLVGQAGTGNIVPAITFDKEGNLYGISGTSSTVNSLISIDKTTGVGTVIGSIGYKHITGLAHSVNDLVSVKDNNTAEIPAEFSLMQNYPNPFNPSTTIEFAIPEASNVKISIYNLLGETVDVLLNSPQKAGVHNVLWNTSSRSLSSGIYFYEISAKGNSGKDYSSIKKMILMK